MRLELYREAVKGYRAVGDVSTTMGTAVATIEVAGRWRWRVVSSNGRIMADSGQGYVRRKDCLDGAAKVMGGSLDGTGCCLLRPNNGLELERVEIRDLS